MKSLCWTNILFVIRFEKNLQDRFRWVAKTGSIPKLLPLREKHAFCGDRKRLKPLREKYSRYERRLLLNKYTISQLKNTTLYNQTTNQTIIPPFFSNYIHVRRRPLMSKYKPPTNLLPLKLSLSVQSRFCAMEKPPEETAGGPETKPVSKSIKARFLKKGSRFGGGAPGLHGRCC